MEQNPQKRDDDLAKIRSMYGHSTLKIPKSI